MVSTGAKIDKATIAKRPCFLCKDNRPQVQISLPFGEEFDILVNPFPILPVHFTIAARQHQLQLIQKHYADLQKPTTIYYVLKPTLWLHLANSLLANVNCVDEY